MNLFNFLTPKAETLYLEDNCTIRQALEKMDYHKYTVIPILNKKGEYVSALSEGDILRYIKNNCHFDLEKAETVKISKIEKYRPYKTLDISCQFEEIVKLSLVQNFIPIVDDRGVFIGILRRKDVIEYFIEKYPLANN